MSEPVPPTRARIDHMIEAERLLRLAGFPDTADIVKIKREWQERDPEAREVEL